MDIYVGTSGYSYPKWKGQFYPAELPEKQMLAFYSQRFRTVEINNTFYRMPNASLLEGWAGQVPQEFKFVLKAPQRITHLQRLLDSGDSLSYLLEMAGLLGARQGPLLFQLPSGFKKDLGRLRDFLALLPPRHQVAFEFRHQSWFDDEVLGLLHKNRVALCIAEAENELRVPAVATAEWGYLRLRRQDYGVAELKGWAKLVRDQKWQSAFVFFKHEDEARGPIFAQRFLELVG